MLPNQTREKQQPFFKPLSSSENSSSVFNFEHAGQTNSSPATRINNYQFSRTNREDEHVMKQDLVSGSEKLTSLHAKLHQEADKIRKWKVQTEIEIKQKDKKVVEAVKTVESLRKSILELQLQNESLSLKLQEEFNNREDLLRKVNGTRDLCSLLKDHTIKVDSKLKECETDRTELKYLEKEHLRQFEELSQSFKKLNIAATEDKNKLNDQLTLERLEKEQLQEQCLQNLSAAELKIQELTEQTTMKDRQISEMQTQFEQNEAQLHSMREILGQLQVTISELQENFQSKDELLCETSEALVLSKEQNVANESHLSEIFSELSDLKHQRNELDEELTKEKICHKEDTETLSDELEGTRKVVEQVHIREHDLKLQCAKYERAVEDLKSSKDILQLEKTDIECKVQELKNIKVNLLIANEAGSSEIDMLKADIDRLQNMCSSCQGTIGTLEGTIKEMTVKIKYYMDEKIQLDAEITSLKETQTEKEAKIKETEKCVDDMQGRNNLSAKHLNDIKDQLDEESNLLAHARQQLQESQTENERLQKDLNGKLKAVTKLEKELQKAVTTKVDTKELLKSKEEQYKKLTDRFEGLQCNVEEQTKKMEELLEERQELDKNLSDELENKSKTASNMESKNKSLKADVANKTKQIKELEKEIKSLTNKMKTQTKQIDNFMTETESLNENIEENIIKEEELNEKLNQMKEEVEKERKMAEKAKKQATESKKMAESAVSLKDNTLTNCDVQRAEMMAMLEKYKQENERIVVQKEKELDAMKDKMNEQHQSNSSLDEVNKNLEEVQGKYEEEICAKEALIKQNEEQTANMKILEADIRTKEQEIKDLLSSTKMLQVKLDAVLARQELLATMPDITPSTPKSKLPQPSTMRGSETPKSMITQRTPQIALVEATPQQYPTKTTPRSILRDINTVSKKRRVAFSAKDDSVGSGSDSSTSELMEFEVEEIENRFKGKQTPKLPLLLRPSPKVRQSPEQLSVEQYNRLTPVPRGKSVHKEPKRQSKMEAVKDIELLRFQELYPESVNDISLFESTEKKIRREIKAPANIRKTPKKQTCKFFKSSPEERPSKLKKLKDSKSKEETSWFDLDSVFGFGPED